MMKVKMKVSLCLLILLGLTSGLIAAEGDILWQTGNIGDSLEALPAVDDSGNVYIQTQEGVRSYTSSGNLRWFTDVSSNDSAYVSLSPDNSTVYGGGSAGAFALNSSNGNVIWTNSVDSFFSVPCVSQDGSRIYFGSRDINAAVGVLYAFDASNGNTIWSRNLNGGLMGGASLDASGTIYIMSQGVNSQNGFLYSITDNGSSSTLNWDNDLLLESRLPVTIGADGSIYASSNTGIIHKFNPANGAEIWQAGCPGGCGEVFAAMALSNDGNTIYVNGEDNALHAFDTSNGNHKWEIGFQTWGSDPLVRNDGVIIVMAQINGAGRVAAIQDNGSSASILWTSPQILSNLNLNETSVNIAPNGTIYVHSGDQNPLALFAIEGNGQGLSTSSAWPKIMGNIQNNGNASVTGGPDTTPPSPNPSTWSSVPAAQSSSAVAMTATTASDPSGPVEYFFDETTAGPGATDSGWQTNSSYTDSGLTACTTYTYTVKARDSVGNETGISTAESVQTNAAGGAQNLGNLLCLGDSITTCMDEPESLPLGGGNTYRYFLWKQFIDAGWTADFIGSLTDLPGCISPDYLGNVFDNDHEGHGGWTTGHILNGNPQDPGAGQLSNWLATYTPDVVLLHLGTNDIDDQLGVPGAITNLGLIIDQLQADNPNVDIYIAQIIPMDNPGVGLEIDVQNLNSQIPGLAASKTTANSTVTAVDQNTGFDFNADTFDGLHPNQSGAIKMANKWAAALGVGGGGSCGGDNDPPTPNPATFATAPNAVSDTQIDMVATTASDPSGPVEYNFGETSGNAGGTDSGWQASISYSDSGLSVSTQYCYTVQSRDSVGNTGTASAASCATTTGGGCSGSWNGLINNTDASISYAGAWQNVPAVPAHNNDAHFTTSNGATASFSFTGVGLRIYVWQLDVAQSFTVAIDGGAAQNVNVGIGPEGSFLAFEETTLSNTSHNVVVTYGSGELHLDAYDFLTGCSDTDPPTPNPATFSSIPSADSDTAISMIATTGSDVTGPVEYFFDETSGNTGGSDSGWQTSINYTDTGLNASTQYCYTIQMRDSVGSPNVGSASAQSCASTQAPPDTAAPIPNPATFASVPTSGSTSSIDMTATTASDATPPIEYLFTETSGNSGGSSSSWQSSTSYTDTLLSPSTQYCYTVTSRDSLGNTGSASVVSCATTDALPDTTPPTPNPMTFASNPTATSSSAIAMTATTATDAQGSTPIEYFFDELTANAGGSDSAWQTSTNYTDTGLLPSTMYSYTVSARDSVGNTTTASTGESATTQTSGGGGGIELEIGVVNGVGSSWTTVVLGSSYSSMVVVATPNYSNASVPATVRIQNASGNSFDIRVDGSPTVPAAMDVYYMVVEEGVYTQAGDGFTLEAVKYNSTVTDNASSTWNGESRTYANSYTNPVVLGQVMTYNDPGHVEFWCHGGSRTSPPTSSTLFTGKTVNEDPDNAHANETIGYIVVEGGNGAIDSINYFAALGADTVRGITNATPPFNYALSTGFSSATFAIACSAGMDGNNGGWALLYGPNPVSPTNLALAFDEDQLAGSERNHTTEQVAYIIFEDLGGGETDPPTPNPSTWSQVPTAISSSAIDMIATMASDPSGPVEYNFDETSGNAGGSDSGWQAGSNYTDSGLSALTQYTYRQQTRDALGNTGSFSTSQSATTQSAGSWQSLVNNTDGSINYVGSWQNVPAFPAHNNDAHFTTSSGATASFSFNGTGLRIYVWQLDVAQSFTVAIDGGSAQTVNVGIGPEGSFLAYENTSLSSGSHSVVITYQSGELHLDAYQVFN